MKRVAIVLGIFFFGIVVGGYLFSNTKPRSFLNLRQCNNTCLRPSEILGLLGSIGIQKVPDFIPFIVKETDKTLVMHAPVKRAPIHYVIIPKKDIKDAADISDEDKEYLIDAYKVIGELIRENHLDTYKIYTNGPGYQTVNYLHFHLISEKKP